jgi:hypothetical protein
MNETAACPTRPYANAAERLIPRLIKTALTAEKNSHRKTSLDGSKRHVTPNSRRTIIAKNQNTYAKRKREMDRKAKAQSKRTRRNKRKLEGGLKNAEEGPSPDTVADGVQVEPGAPT